MGNERTPVLNEFFQSRLKPNPGWRIHIANADIIQRFIWMSKS
jgi:hypothetical protein